MPTSSLRPGQGPHSGDDTYDLIDHALHQLTERRGAWLGDDLTAITRTASLIDQAERFLPEPVTSALLNGHTWHDIAQALATSPDEGRRRFDPDSPVADGRQPYDTETAKAGPLQAVTTAPNPHPVGPDQAVRAGPLLLTYEITGLLLHVDVAVEQFAIGMLQADPVTTKNGG